MSGLTLLRPMCNESALRLAGCFPVLRDCSWPWAPSETGWTRYLGVSTNKSGSSKISLRSRPAGAPAGRTSRATSAVRVLRVVADWVSLFVDFGLNRFDGPIAHQLDDDFVIVHRAVVVMQAGGWNMKPPALIGTILSGLKTSPSPVYHVPLTTIAHRSLSW